MIKQYGSSNQELERKAAIKIIGNICDSDCCLDPIKEEIFEWTEFIVKGLKDSSVIHIPNIINIVYC